MSEASGPPPADTPAPDTRAPGTPGLSRASLVAGSGLLVLGISASVFLVVTARMVGPVAFTGVAVLWTLVYTVGIGVFLPFEQELSRAASVRLARGEGAGALLRLSALVALGVLAALVVLVVAAMLVPAVRDPLLDGSWAYAAGLLVAVAGLGLQYLQRGSFSATGDFVGYGAQQGVEGVVRTVACLVLAAAGVDDPRAYVAVLALSPHVSVVALAGRLRRTTGTAGGPAHWHELRGRFGWLLVATLGSQALANLAAPAVRVLSSPREVEAAGNFLSALTIARIPLLLFAAVQAALLPRLVRAREAGDRREFGQQLRVVLAATAAVGLAGVLGVAVLGPWVLRLLFGPAFGLPRSDLVLLALSAGVLMLGLALQSAVVALDDHRGSALAWVAGVAVFLAVLVVPAPVLLRVELALVVGSVAVVALLGTAVRRHLADLAVSGRRN
ncbi:lipopolysaccharide biosynthesis protein [Nocardioides aurantiacus]|uniref:O-antigen/teichoic acid export membrane protein n=1 Tax=Nocardioides aurantiacus TaxID=86796 RepID=A0A3N2CY13_9ACTN|nr:hypothetical protein [Nocardioides aurantiacus]ROR92409.1 O-antigen/teichoic acid export membrane protein [Nocardioides aurantiacus]